LADLRKPEIELKFELHLFISWSKFNSINLFSHAQLQYKLCGGINDYWLLLRHIAYLFTRRSHNTV